MILLDYAFLKIAWWLGIGMVFVMYAMTAGYDLGVTIYLPFIQDELDQRVALNASGFTWDGNQSWIVFAGGGLFVIWPVVYAAALSFFYLPMAFIIVAFFLRPTGYDYRGKVASAKWRRAWDWALWWSAVVPTFFFGAILGSVLQGVPLHFMNYTQRLVFDGSPFALIFSPFSVLCGLASVVMIMMHGASFLFRRTTGELRAWAQLMHRYTGAILSLLMTVVGLYLFFLIPGYQLEVFDTAQQLPMVHSEEVIRSVGGWMKSYITYPWKGFALFFFTISWCTSMFCNYINKARICFYANAATVAWLIVSIGVTLFPFLIPSSSFPAHSVTMWNGVANHYALNIMFFIATVLMGFTMFYKLFTFSVFWGKKETLSREEVLANDRVYY